MVLLVGSDMRFSPYLLFLALSTAGCGRVVHENHNKNYTLSVFDATPEEHAVFSGLVDDFNRRTGLVVLKYTEDSSQANSPIRIVDGLKGQSHGKIGWGQWKTETAENDSLSGTKLETTRYIDYSMNIELDKEFVSTRLGAEEGSEGHYDLSKLFFHEAGHGLQMSHHPDPNHLMYYEVSGEKDFDGFFAEVLRFFDPENKLGGSPST